jgi:hypothetical protein
MTDTGLFGSMYATPGGVDPLAIMRGIVENRNNPPSMYATPGGVDPLQIMMGIVQQQQPQTPPPVGGQVGTQPNYNGSLYFNPQSGLPDPLRTMMDIIKNHQNGTSSQPTQLPIWARGGAQPGGGHGPMGPPAPYYQPPKQAPMGPQGPPQAPAWNNPWGSLNGGWG